MSKKKPIIPLPRKNSKTPKLSSLQNTNTLTPSWLLSQLDYEGDFGWNKINREKLTTLLKRLSQFESMTWGEIIGKENHFIPVRDLQKSAQKRLQAIQLDDIEELFSLRVKGQERVFGIRIGSKYKILWWDPKHAVCPSYKKHT